MRVEDRCYRDARFCKKGDMGACAVGEIVNTELWMQGMWNLVLMICVNRCCDCESSVKSLALVLWCVSIKVRQRWRTEVLNVNRQCDCVVCVLFDQPKVSFDLLRLFSGSPPFWLHHNLLPMCCHMRSEITQIIAFRFMWAWVFNTSTSYFQRKSFQYSTHYLMMKLTQG